MKQQAILLFMLLFTASNFAQAPQAFNYQGVARDLSGDPIPNRNIGIRITILQDSPMGAEVFQEIHAATTTNLGLFNLHIGTGNSVNGNFSNIDWGHQSHFLQIEMDENGGTNYQLLGTSELLSVPYALYAENGSRWDRFEQGLLYEDTFLDSMNISSPLTVELFNKSNDIRAYSRYRVTSGTNALSYGGVLAYFPPNFYNPIFANFTEVASYKETNGLMLRTSASAGIIKFITRHDEEKMRISANGFVGIGSENPQSKLQIDDGDIYIEDVNRGVIMKSPNGQCWRMTVSNTGQAEFTLINCPN
jgi:hypothetical protein